MISVCHCNDRKTSSQGVGNDNIGKVMSFHRAKIREEEKKSKNRTEQCDESATKHEMSWLKRKHWKEKKKKKNEEETNIIWHGKWQNKIVQQKKNNSRTESLKLRQFPMRIR